VPVALDGRHDALTPVSMAVGSIIGSPLVKTSLPS
jgi:hypothetical protein